VSLHTREALLALGFVCAEDAMLTAPVGTNITFTPIGQFFELRLELGNNTVVTAVLHHSAIKVCREEAVR
jgi:hypothetical protein